MRRIHIEIILAAVLATLSGQGTAQGAAPLKEKGVVAMVDAGFEDQEIVAKIDKDGIEFQLDDATEQRLRTAGVSDAVLAALKTAASKPAAAGKPLVTFESVLSLLENGVESDLIIARLKKSGATFVLSTEQQQQLEAAGATAALIEAMARGPKDADTAEPISDLAIVLDVSASMKETTADGRPKVDVAKEVVSGLIQQLPAGLNVCVVVYGHAPGCSAVKVLRGLQELKAAEKAELVSAIQQLTPVGNTPIALALRQVGQQFAGRKTYCGVVLITDGLESCNGDPSAEAARLAENPLLRFGVNVVGFGLKAEESEATSQIAESGKGRYYDAKDGDALSAAIVEVTTRIGKGVEPAPFNPAAPKGPRAVVVTRPEIAMPALKELVTARPGASYGTVEAYKINSVTNYEEELRQPSADKVDVWWVPADGNPVCMVAEFENPQRQVQRLRPEDYLGLVRVTSEEGPAETKIVITLVKASAGTIHAYDVQEIAGYNKDLVVPVGTYKLWVVEPNQEPMLLEDGLEVAGGQVTVVEN